MGVAVRLRRSAAGNAVGGAVSEGSRLRRRFQTAGRRPALYFWSKLHHFFGRWWWKRDFGKPPPSPKPQVMVVEAHFCQTTTIAKAATDGGESAFCPNCHHRHGRHHRCKKRRRQGRFCFSPKSSHEWALKCYDKSVVKQRTRE